MEPTRNADTARVEVRVVDLYELVRYFYGTSSSFARPATGLAADRCNAALCGVPRIDLILKAHAAELNDGVVCAPPIDFAGSEWDEETDHSDGPNAPPYAIREEPLTREEIDSLVILPPDHSDGSPDA